MHVNPQIHSHPRKIMNVHLHPENPWTYMNILIIHQKLYTRMLSSNYVHIHPQNSSASSPYICMNVNPQIHSNPRNLFICT